MGLFFNFMSHVFEQQTNLKSLFVQANQARAREDDVLAEKIYQQILKIKPDSAAALHDLGLLLLEKQQPELACQALQQATKLFSNDANYFYHLAEALRACGKLSEAITHYKQALQIKASEPDFYFGLANVYCDLKQFDTARSAYEKVVELNPQDFEAFNNLGNVLSVLGKSNAAMQMYSNAISANPDYAQAHMNLSAELKLLGQTQASLKYAKVALRLAPDDIDCRLNLAEIYSHLKQYDTSGQHFLEVLLVNQENKRALTGYAKMLVQSGDLFRAIDYFNKAVKVDPDDMDSQLQLSSCLIRLQRFTQAENVLLLILKHQPCHARALFNYGLCQQAHAKFNMALDLHRQCWRSHPQLTQAAYHMVVNGNYKVKQKDICTMEKQLSNLSLSIEKQIHLNFAIAKAYEKTENFVRAFDYFRKANLMKSEILPFNADKHLDYVARIKNVFDENYFSRRQGYGISNIPIIFIVGMPRSGSTLVEQILASHTQVQAQGEHLAMPVILKKLPQYLKSVDPVPECARDISAVHSKMLAQRYLDYLKVNQSSRQLLTDKMLGNFLRLGLIALMFPNARIVNCQRNTLDTCVSCFTQDFAHGLRFTTNLTHLGVFYNTYKSLMHHWHECLPLEIMNFRYEELIDNKEHSIRKLLEFCQLPFQNKCLEFHQTQRLLSTASFWQARQPLYKDSIQRWQHYQSYIAPLIKSLETNHTHSVLS